MQRCFCSCQLLDNSHLRSAVLGSGQHRVKFMHRQKLVCHINSHCSIVQLATAFIHQQKKARRKQDEDAVHCLPCCVAHILIRAEADFFEFLIILFHFATTVGCIDAQLCSPQELIRREAPSTGFQHESRSISCAKAIAGVIVSTRRIAQIDRFPAFPVAILQGVLSEIELGLTICNRADEDQE